jgi:hypothetical protein
LNAPKFPKLAFGVGYDFAQCLSVQEEGWLRCCKEKFAVFIRGDMVAWSLTEPKGNDEVQDRWDGRYSNPLELVLVIR